MRKIKECANDDRLNTTTMNTITIIFFPGKIAVKLLGTKTLARKICLKRIREKQS